MRDPLSAFEALLPGTAETHFFKAALLDGPACATAFDLLQAAVDYDLKAFLIGPGAALRGHLPLLHENLERNGVPIPREYEPYFRTATARAKLRHATFERCLRDVLTVLAASAIPHVIVKGAAASYLAYKTPYLRHCHDVDLLVSPDDQDTLVGEFAQAGFEVHPADPSTPEGSICVTHKLGLPVMLHSRAIHGPPLMPATAMLESRQSIDTPAGPMNVPPPSATLAHVCAHALSRGRRAHFNWVPDAVHLARELPPKARANLPMEASLHLRADYAMAYLEKHFDGTAQRFAKAAPAQTQLQTAILLDSAFHGQPEAARTVFKHADLRRRASFLTKYLRQPPQFAQYEDSALGVLLLKPKVEQSIQLTRKTGRRLFRLARRVAAKLVRGR